MPRYIDADVLKKCFPDGKDQMFLKFDSDIRYIIDNEVPTADVEEVRHERWEPYLESDDLRSNYFRCTGCKRIEEVPRGLNVKEWKPYCHCGAKMDLEEQTK